jgi:hypothetical protein
MASAFHNPVKRIRLSIPALASAVCLLAAACATTSPKLVEAILVDGPRGAVYLQKGGEDSWFKAAHPLYVSPRLLTHVFRGVEVQVLPADKTTARRVFSDEDTEFISPLISTALSKATKGQLVGFRVHHGTNAGSDSTGGVLYVQGRLLHLSLTHYRADTGRREIGAEPDRQFPNPTGLEQRQISFIPEAARRSSLNEQPDLVNPPPLATVVIDFELLAKGLEPQSASGQSQPLYLYPDVEAATQQALQSIISANGVATSQETRAAHAEEIRSLKDDVMKKTTELDVVKEEVRALQRRLADLEVEAQKTKKRQSALPQRKSVP